jgi:hypothetical protein
LWCTSRMGYWTGWKIYWYKNGCARRHSRLLSLTCRRSLSMAVRKWISDIMWCVFIKHRVSKFSVIRHKIRY